MLIYTLVVLNYQETCVLRWGTCKDTRMPIRKHHEAPKCMCSVVICRQAGRHVRRIFFFPLLLAVIFFLSIHSFRVSAIHNAKHNSASIHTLQESAKNIDLVRPSLAAPAHFSLLTIAVQCHVLILLLLF